MMQAPGENNDNIFPPLLGDEGVLIFLLYNKMKKKIEKINSFVFL